MYLWKMVIRTNGETTFKFTEHTTDKEKKSCTGYFETDQSYSQEEPTIEPIIEATINLCKILDLDLNKHHVLVERGFKSLTFIYIGGVFEAKLSNKDGSVIIRTENEYCFNKEQFNAIFDFIDIIKKLNWFF